VFTGGVGDLTGLEALLLNDTSEITELEIHRYDVRARIAGLTRVLQALGRCSTLTTLGLRCCPLYHDEAKLLQLALCNIPSLQGFVLSDGTLGSAGLAALAPALSVVTSIKVLDIYMDAGNGTFGVPKPFSPFDTPCVEREASTSWCLAAYACPGSNTP
jgi:hypothetical protein